MSLLVLSLNTLSRKLYQASSMVSRFVRSTVFLSHAGDIGSCSGQKPENSATLSTRYTWSDDSLDCQTPLRIGVMTCYSTSVIDDACPTQTLERPSVTGDYVLEYIVMLCPSHFSSGCLSSGPLHCVNTSYERWFHDKTHAKTLSLQVYRTV